MNIYAFLILVIQLFFIKIDRKHSESELYNVRYNQNEIAIDGVLSKEEWDSADSIIGLVAPWDPDSHDETVFKALHNSDFYYFCFNVSDDDVIIHDFKEELTVSQEDRVELFFSRTTDLKHYFCIEMDPAGKILDYSARYHRIFDESWNFSQIRIAAKNSPSGYVVEGSIPLDELRKMGISNSLFMGIFRADYRSSRTDDVVWHSWIKPDSKTADFHIPSAFGLVKLEPGNL